MKVSEAKEKVCPFIQNAEQLEAIHSDTEWSFAENTPVNINCITEYCMAWVSNSSLEGYCSKLNINKPRIYE